MSLFPDDRGRKTEDTHSLWERFVLTVRPLKSKRTAYCPPIPRFTKKRIRVRTDPPLFQTLDLHGQTFEAAFSILSDFLFAHHAAGSKSVTVITGKGRGEETLSALFPKWMKNPAFTFVSKIEALHGGGSYTVSFRKRKR